jgi:sulfate adenylyltransferase
MLGAGYFNPLTGFMNKADALSICGNFCTTDGLFWPVPVINMFNSKPTFGVGSKICLQDPNIDGNPVMATMNVSAVEEVSDDEINFMLKSIYGTTDSNHPGVVTFKSLGNFLVSGSVTVLNLSYFHTDFPGTFRTAQEIRDEIQSRGWDKVVAFQTRNPMHRAHEELCRMAMERLDADGLIVHMLLGKLKLGDLPAEVRDDCIRTMVDNYFPENSVMVTGYGFDMLYAGPREALLHAIFRQNMGATHLIVGRDHAGVGDFYGPFEAQEVFDKHVPNGALDIQIFKADHTAFSKKLGQVVMMNEVEDHTKDDFVLLSGTAVREMLGKGIVPPNEFSRPEVAKVLIDYYQIEDY